VAAAENCSDWHVSVTMNVIVQVTCWHAADGSKQSRILYNITTLYRLRVILQQLHAKRHGLYLKVFSCLSTFLKNSTKIDSNYNMDACSELVCRLLQQGVNWWIKQTNISVAGMAYRAWLAGRHDNTSINQSVWLMIANLLPIASYRHVGSLIT